MKINYLNFILLTAMGGIMLFSCTGKDKKTSENMKKTYEKGTFGYDLDYLSEKDSLIVLKSDDEKAQVIVSAKYQAKVFTSTANGLDGPSLGFVNYKVFDSGVIDEHMNGYGGENRLWLGPEGGRYSIFFEPGIEQIYDNWHTPKAFDIEAWQTRSVSQKEAIFAKDMELKNYLGNLLKVEVERKISLIPISAISQHLFVSLPEGVSVVAYATDNKIINKNDFEWTPETGTVCIWMLDMFNPSDSAVTIVPYREGDEKELGKVATTNYFGEIPANRLKDENGVLFLKTDGKYRSKIGMNAKRTKGIAGNFDPISKRLTIVTFDVDPSKIYLNQEWNPKKNPLIGDAFNAYNDGPLDDGSIMGPFLELESCSPAAFLKPGESISHKHNVFHFVGDEEVLSPICETLLGVNIDKVKQVF
jgi:hypothetical protein